MAQQTTQSVTATPGRIHSFSAKTESVAASVGILKVNGIEVDAANTAVRTVSTTTYTLSASDHNTILLFDHASGCTVTGPVASSEDLYSANNAFICHLHQEAATQVTFVAEVGATSRTAIGLKTRVQYSSISIIVIASSTFKVIGDSVA
jgi:hypothetical protein